MATLLNLMQQLRLRLDDQGGDTGEPGAGFSYYWEYDSTGCLWSNDELVGHLNEAENEFCRRVPLIDDKEFRIRTVPGVAHYDLDPVILAVERVFSTSRGCPLRKTFHEASDQQPFRTVPAARYQASLSDHQLTILGTPIDAEVLELTVRRLPLTPLLWADRKTQEPEVSAHWAYSLVDYAAYLSWCKRDADTFSPDNAMGALAAFDRLVGPTKSAAEWVWAKSLSNRRPRARGQFL